MGAANLYLRCWICMPCFSAKLGGPPGMILLKAVNAGKEDVKIGEGVAAHAGLQIALFDLIFIQTLIYEASWNFPSTGPMHHFGL